MHEDGFLVRAAIVVALVVCLRNHPIPLTVLLLLLVVKTDTPQTSRRGGWRQPGVPHPPGGQGVSARRATPAEDEAAEKTPNWRKDGEQEKNKEEENNKNSLPNFHPTPAKQRTGESWARLRRALYEEMTTGRR